MKIFYFIQMVVKQKVNCENNDNLVLPQYCISFIVSVLVLLNPLVKRFKLNI